LPEEYDFTKFKLMEQLEYILVRILYGITGIIPFTLGGPLSKIMAFIVQKIFLYRRNVVRSNLKLAFPGYDRRMLKKIEKDVYRNFMMLWIEVLQNFRLGNEFFSRHFKICNWEVVEQARRDNKGIIFLTSHFGNYEWLGGYIGHTLGDFYVIAQRIKNPKVHAFLVRTRAQTRAQLIDRREGSKKGVELLLARKNLGIVTDQDARARGIFVDFFGVPASTAVGTAYFHLRTGAALIFCINIRKKWGDFELHFERLPGFFGQPINDKTLYQVTQLHTAVLEKWVRTYPGQYFWTHRRWKSKPTPAQQSQYDLIKNR
jgi:KDO2-lipid IV(A) lauroyltransferase